MWHTKKMMHESLNLKQKSKEEFENQLDKVEFKIGQNLVSKNKKEELFSLSINELKDRYPDQYEIYLKTLRIGAQEIRLSTESVDTIYSPEEYDEICNKILIKNESIPEELHAKLVG